MYSFNTNKITNHHKKTIHSKPLCQSLVNKPPGHCCKPADFLHFLQIIGEQLFSELYVNKV